MADLLRLEPFAYTAWVCYGVFRKNLCEEPVLPQRALQHSPIGRDGTFSVCPYLKVNMLQALTLQGFKRHNTVL